MPPLDDLKQTLNIASR